MRRSHRVEEVHPLEQVVGHVVDRLRDVDHRRPEHVHLKFKKSIGCHCWYDTCKALERTQITTT